MSQLRAVFDGPVIVLVAGLITAWAMAIWLPLNVSPRARIAPTSDAPMSLLGVTRPKWGIIATPVPAWEAITQGFCGFMVIVIPLWVPAGHAAAQLHRPLTYSDARIIGPLLAALPIPGPGPLLLAIAATVVLLLTTLGADAVWRLMVARMRVPSLVWTIRAQALVRFIGYAAAAYLGAVTSYYIFSAVPLRTAFVGPVLASLVGIAALAVLKGKKRVT